MSLYRIGYFLWRVKMRYHIKEIDGPNYWITFDGLENKDESILIETMIKNDIQLDSDVANKIQEGDTYTWQIEYGKSYLITIITKAPLQYRVENAMEYGVEQTEKPTYSLPLF